MDLFVVAEDFRLYNARAFFAYSRNIHNLAYRDRVLHNFKIRCVKFSGIQYFNYSVALNNNLSIHNLVFARRNGNIRAYNYFGFGFTLSNVENFVNRELLLSNANERVCRCTDYLLLDVFSVYTA